MAIVHQKRHVTFFYNQMDVPSASLLYIDYILMHEVSTKL